MKVILTAFHGKLKGTMELPDNWDHRDIYLMMDMDIVGPEVSFSEKFPTVAEPLMKRARFQYSGRGDFVNGKVLYEYKLVGLS